MRFYKGALTYQDLMFMPVSELIDWQERAKKITEDFNKEMERREKQARR
jgi:hypothetical protein